MQKYSRTAKAFHWIIGLGMIGMLGFGVYMADFAQAPGKFALYGWHKSIGITILGLTIARILWRLTHSYPQSLPTHKKLEKLGAKIVHLVLYMLIVLIPLSGWYMSSSGGHPVSFFGLFEMPALMDKNKSFAGFFNETHKILGYACIGIIVLHVLGALKHHYIDKDSTLRRMLPFAKKS